MQSPRASPCRNHAYFLTSTVDASECTCRRCPRLTIGAGFLCLRPMIDSRAEVRPKESARKKKIHRTRRGKGPRGVRNCQSRKINLNCRTWIPLTWYYYGSLRGRRDGARRSTSLRIPRFEHHPHGIEAATINTIDGHRRANRARRGIALRARAVAPFTGAPITGGAQVTCSPIGRVYLKNRD